jgi:hypothetical protein
MVFLGIVSTNACGDNCEIFFKKIGGTVGLKHTYDFHEIMNTTNTLNHLVWIDDGTNGLKLNIRYRHP